MSLGEQTTANLSDCDAGATGMTLIVDDLEVIPVDVETRRSKRAEGRTKRPYRSDVGGTRRTTRFVGVITIAIFVLALIGLEIFRDPSTKAPATACDVVASS